jgi:hypothetical protein
MINTENKVNTSNYVRVISEKKQIILGNSYSYNKEGVLKMVNRDGGNFNKVPHFTIMKNGEILQHFDIKYYSYYLDNEHSKDVISIAIQNMGLLFENKSGLMDMYNNTYQGEVIVRPWKNGNFWEPYTEYQLDAAIFLCKYLLSEANINKAVVHSNVQKADVSNFKGICFRSNYDSKHYDISPAWDFETFKKAIE